MNSQFSCPLRHDALHMLLCIFKNWSSLHKVKSCFCKMKKLSHFSKMLSSLTYWMSQFHFLKVSILATYTSKPTRLSVAHEFHMWYAFGPYFGDDFISSRQHKRNSNTLIQICILWKKSRSKWYSRCFTDNKIILIFDIFGTKIRNCNVSNNSLQYLAIKSQMFYRHKKILIFDIFWH